MLIRLVTLGLVCFGLSACYLGDSGTKLWKDMQEHAAQEAAKSK